MLEYLICVNPALSGTRLGYLRTSLLKRLQGVKKFKNKVPLSTARCYAIITSREFKFPEAVIFMRIK